MSSSDKNLDLSAPGAIGGSTPAAGTFTTLSATSQPCFLVQPSADLTNVTGDATLYTVVFATEITDQGGDFDGTSTFTAPTAGNYQFNITLSAAGITGSHTKAQIRLVTSNRTYRFGTVNLANAARVGTADATIGGSVIADMDASDTAVIQIVVENGTKVVDIEAANSFFSGQKIS